MIVVDWALFYGDLGWHVFPLAEGSKLPKIAKADGGRGFHDATTDPDLIRSWWARWPRANVGIRTGSRSGIFVLDVDVRHRGDESLHRLTEKCEKLPDTLRAQTPSGGWHFYFRWPEVELRNSAGILDDGLDTRGEGGYVAAAPSVVARVGEYRWENWGQPLASTPPWLVRLLRKPKRGPDNAIVRVPRQVAGTLMDRIVADRVHRVATAPMSRRNSTLNVSAFYLGTFVGAGLLDPERVWNELFVAAQAVGLEDRETRATISSGMTAGIAAPARWSA